MSLCIDAILQHPILLPCRARDRTLSQTSEENLICVEVSRLISYRLLIALSSGFDYVSFCGADKASKEIS